MNVLVYSDEGVSSTCVQQLERALLGELSSSFTIRLVKASFLTQGGWEKGAYALVFPGGRDLPYHQKLQREGNRRIRAFVEEGGFYLGLCAGAYYGSREIAFEQGTPLEICAPRELGLFPGVAVGPAYGCGYFDYEGLGDARLAEVEWGGESYSVFYNGGCFFKEPEKYPEVEVLGRYRDLPGNPAAIIRCKVGKGVALLSGVHLERPLFHRAETKRLALWAEAVGGQFR